MTTVTTDSLAFYARSDVKRTNRRQCYSKIRKSKRTICTYCGYGDHVVDKCYKLHGYPPGYKTKQRSSSTNQTGPGSNNQIGYNIQANNAMSNKVFDSIPNQTIGNVGKFVQTLSPASMSILSDILRLQIWKMKE